ncbi:hypothetical protein [Cryobacterium levicorallinum]|uniref:DUF222 domain-containing protein n=2 Tax=Cryobacterium levicorallinum TaxID=995038 RepID=A0ABY1EGJ1_9MICO|nr:hypothetical protein [Cryobacterium levicorallinum]GEP27846.1 hypothetical protein CLE01_24440 [Cryobacterium levicorallinum]SFH76938.1 hypothetical protein SAMN05216274_11471 [Cryobacterium levicorallinum]
MLDQPREFAAEKLAAALRVLLVAAPGMNTEQAYKRARRRQDDLDAAGILVREKQARDDTTWSLWRRADGMVTLHALFPPEQGEMWMAAYDALTSPRRGGVRFVDPERAAWAQSVKDDPPTLCPPVAGPVDGGESRDAGRDQLDHRRGDDPTPGHPHDDYQN